MLKKLMKYELMATGRIFLPLYAALIVFTLINRLLQLLPVTAPQVISIIISVILMVGIMVLTFVITLQRFRNNLLSSEGYLMMTLPVSTDSLIISKMLAATIWNLASVIVVMASIFILIAQPFRLEDIAYALRSVWSLVSGTPMQSIVYTVELLVVLMLSSFSGILLLYACMSLGMLVNKRRGLFSFGAYIVITTAIQTVCALIFALLLALNATDFLDFSEFTSFSQIQAAILFWLAVAAAVCAAFYFLTRYMLKSRLNLQ